MIVVGLSDEVASTFGNALEERIIVGLAGSSFLVWVMSKNFASVCTKRGIYQYCST